MDALRLESVEFPGFDPAFNLALEECLARELPDGHPGYFLLWQNAPSIIIGRHQCVCEVVNETFATEAGLPVIRRMTGGGAVYHDEGNLNFSFIIHGRGGLSFARFLEPVCAALAALGVDNVTISGRNDLEVDGKKISGSGQCVLGDTILHHGTLLVRANLEYMARALKVDDAKIKSRGVASLRARVANLGELPGLDIDVPKLKAALIAHCAEKPATLPDGIVAAAATLATEKYSSWDWNYGRSPACELKVRTRFPWGDVSAGLSIRGGRIRHCVISGDFFTVLPIETLERKFSGLAFNPETVARELAAVPWPAYFRGCDSDAMREFFTRGLFA